MVNIFPHHAERANLFLFSKTTVKLSTHEEDFLPKEFHLIHKVILERLQRPVLRMILRQLGPALVSAIQRKFGQ